MSRILSLRLVHAMHALTSNKCNRADVFNDTFHAFKRAVIRYDNEL